MRCVVNVATGPYVRGQKRLTSNKYVIDEPMMMFIDEMPPGSPSHKDNPYAFKAWAMKHAADHAATLLLWADACILPIRSLEPLWERIERDGYWISRNGYRNSEWTTDSAYADLGVTHEKNDGIEHVVATAFGLNLEHEKGRYIFDEYFRLAQTNAFKGPWTGGIGVKHRHDQTALSVVAWRAGCELTDPPNVFAYASGVTEDTILSADARY